MICDNCGENEANVSYTQIVNGVTNKMHLCEKCAKDLGISSMSFDMPSFNMPISLSSFLGDFFEEDKGILPAYETKELKCNRCGMTYEEFIDKGKFGCEECYNIFSKKIDPILKNIHGGTSHLGRKLNKTTGKQDEKVKQNIQEDKKEFTDNEKIDKLKLELKNAIKDERYEDAAKLRDEIKKFENKGE